MTRLVNTHDQLVAAGGGIAIVPVYLPGRTRSRYGWGVYRVNAAGKALVTSRDAAWFENGMKTFGDLKYGGKAEALAAAKAWCAEHFKVTEWKGNWLRDYVPADIARKFPIRRRET